MKPPFLIRPPPAVIHGVDAVLGAFVSEDVRTAIYYRAAMAAEAVLGIEAHRWQWPSIPCMPNAGIMLQRVIANALDDADAGRLERVSVPL